ncbi:hypothetical protein G6F37_010947 [Rhizopus arrhizus]|nr:hypothetical protein G6F38_011456 [Rhizopus arrhizus]KAG1151658.1 hypothetical protein G6F37_010947 [Rhizopus arrhizus]
MGSSLSQHEKKRRKSLLNQNKKQEETVSSSSTLTRSPLASSDSVVVDGRTYHGEASSVYWLPNDDEELDRLVGQHFAMKTLFGGNIPKEVHKHVDMEKGIKILDLGCGPGTWIMDMATEYPNSEFTGIDMSDVFPNNIRPANVTFQIANVLEPLPFEDDTFDFVNFSLFILALKKDQWIPVMKEVKRILKPGGLYHSREASMLLKGNSFVQWAGQVFTERLIEREQEPCIIDKVKELMKLAGFDVIYYKKLPTYPGRSDRLNREFLWDVKHVFKNCQPFLKEHVKVKDEEYDDFLDRFVQECQKKPEVEWDFASTLGRKPVQSI